VNGKTVSAEAAVQRVATGVNVGLAVVLTVPFLGMLLGAVLAIQLVVRVLLVSGQRLKDFFFLAFVVMIGFVGMAAPVFFLTNSWRIVALVFASDFVLNLWIVGYALNKKLAHLWTTPEN
jgi:hypothetical protein